MVSVTMKGALEPFVLDQEYVETVNALNVSAAQGKKFILADARDGKNIALAIDNILAIVEQDVDIFDNAGLT